MGDFNDICSNGEKWGGNERSEGSFRDFKGFISENELVDIGFVGVPWTWCNTWEGEGEVKERLDRCLGSVGWVQVYEKVTCEHIGMEASDHCLLMVDTKPQQRNGRRRFFFDQRWAKDKATVPVIRTAWGKVQDGSRMYKVTRKIRECRVALIEWNRSTKGNAKLKIQEIKEQLKVAREAGELCNKGVIATLKFQLSKAYKEEELYWSQKSRNRWLKEGDKNTAFFHQSVLAKRKRNRISVLQKSDGNWCWSDKEIEEEMCNHYNELFMSTNPTEFEEVLQGIPCTISNLMNAQLIKPVDEGEIKKAIFSMFPNKAPGVDGMSPCFFQSYWNIINADIVHAISSFFHTGNLLKAFNETIISLIPKVDNPVMLANFRPISLCNVLYKIISKILANRLKRVLKHCISPSQSAFIPGRQILDNVIIAHELLHFLKSKRAGKVGFMTLKLDMSKAYDRVEWKFLGRIMMQMGFCPTFVRWIMTCVSTVAYSFNLNGQKVGRVKPSRGIRQGDPLSPYLFIICTEGLSNLIKKAVDNKHLTGIKICRDSPMVSHLFFADDSLLCCKASKKEAQKLKEVLRIYGQASGQVVNFDKSAMFLSRNSPKRIRGEVSKVLDNMKEANSGKYLGLPMTIGRDKNQVFGFLMNNIISKLQSWKQKLLSQGGKEVLIKAVIMAMPTYIMSCFKLPKGLCKAVSAKIARFWWGGGEQENKVHWVRWSKLSEVKGKGGMGFRDLEASNLAMLAKQIWRIVINPNLLVSKVLKARYMKEEDWLGQQPPNNASWCWKKGGKWNIGLLQLWFNEDIVNQISNIPLSLYNRKDRLFWKHSKSGIYTVKTGYVIAKEEKEVTNQRPAPDPETSWEIRKHTVWKTLWSLNIKLKLKHFLWRCLQNGLATKDALYKRFGIGNKFCHCCGEDMETIEHIFFTCPTAKVIWKIAPVRWEGLAKLQGNLWRWWEAVLQAAKKSEGVGRIQLTANILWQIWKARNKVTFQQEITDAKNIVDKAQQEWIEYEAAMESDTGPNSESEKATPIQQRWEPPKEGTIRINTDAAISAKMVRSGLGIIARNWRGEVVRAKGITARRKGIAATEEALAIRGALEMAQIAGWTTIEVQSDCKHVVSLINMDNGQDCSLQTILDDIDVQKGNFESCTFTFVPRTVNQCSHELAQFAAKATRDFEWEGSFPAWLSSLVRKDMGVVTPFCN
nr:uncharacterized protein LOC113737334 [Coffea arabica]